jgi:AraC family ethanolamine operon transcriptional activator
MDKGQSKPKFLNSRFQDVDQLAEAVSSRRRVRLTQLRRQAFQANLTLAEFNAVQFLVLESACPFHTVGEKLPGFIDFACILRTGQREAVAHKMLIDQQTLFGFDPNRGVDLSLPGNLKLAVVQVKQSIFEDYLEILERTDLDQHFWENNAVHLDCSMLEIRSYLTQLLHVAQTHSSFLEMSNLERLILEDFLPLLVAGLPTKESKLRQHLRPLKRAQLVKEAEAYIEAHFERPLTLKDLCLKLKVSRRSIHYAFQDVFGLSPMAYLKQLRLHAIRKALQAADPTTTTVWEIMGQFGFWSSGHFARDYKALFGESPSETLRRAFGD